MVLIDIIDAREEEGESILVNNTYVLMFRCLVTISFEGATCLVLDRDGDAATTIS